MATFPPCTHGVHADDIARKDRQKWEVAQRLKFLSVQTCLLDIAKGNKGVTKDVSVYGTWTFLYVTWHYTEIFFSLHASLERSMLPLLLCSSAYGKTGLRFPMPSP